MNVLIVDDEIVQIENLRIGLSSRGHHIFEALNGNEALSLIENDVNQIDLVITDYAMPGMNGIELLQNIRWRHGHIPVIMMTAYGHRDLILDALRNQCNGFIDKPFTLDRLIDEIDKVQGLVLDNIPPGSPQISKKQKPSADRFFASTNPFILKNPPST
ncbi:MAG: response regulator [Deltaproteobacteria bacterium]|nr:response regulator [Deltaproteobacteria bacterium]